MDKINALSVMLYDEQIGIITQLPGDKNIFTFSPEYLAKTTRPTLSLSFKDSFGGIQADVKATRTRLAPFFSNLLPEGILREYLASQAHVSAEREFELLKALGQDMPGSLTVHPAQEAFSVAGKQQARASKREKNDGILHFSLAGVQLKFSAIWGKSDTLTIPADGVGGSWIIKLPSTLYPNVPENEYAMMSLAKEMGMNVPEIALIPIEHIGGIPNAFKKPGEMVYAIRRFDRKESGEKIHIEDFAQVFGIYPEQKYKAVSYRNIAEVLYAETKESGLVEFLERFVFNALIGNGDMHAKNWSLIYPDKIAPRLAPAYDFVSTIFYLPGDELALNFVDSKAFTSLTIEQFKRFAAKGRFPESLVMDVVQETVKRFKNTWHLVKNFRLDPLIVKTIEEHFKKIPIYLSCK